jgi:hypothetical protein
MLEGPQTRKPTPGALTWRRPRGTSPPDPAISDLSSTVAAIEDAPRTPRSWEALPLWLVSISLLVLVTVSAQGSSETTARSGPWEVTLTHASVTRAGQPAPLRFQVRSDTPIEDPLIVRVCGTWFDSMDFQNWYPNPSSETRSGNTLVYEFDAPNTTSLTIAFDGRSSPGEFGALLPCRVSMSSADGEIFAKTFRTWRLP